MLFGKKKNKEQYKCACGFVSDKPGTHCGQLLQKA